MLWQKRFRKWLDRWWSPAPSAPAPRPPRPGTQLVTLPLSLALQGGGAHGAFTWGVLDRLLDETDLSFPRISGTSAGAMNGAMLVSGFASGGRAGAQKALADFWEAVGEIGAIVAPFQAQQASLSNGFGLLGAGFVDAMMRMWSPSQFNPFNLNPLRDALEKLVDVDALRHNAAMRLYVCATNVETGQARVFEGEELSIDALLASACLPFLYQAVQIDGVPYWDGGYAANPALCPLVDGASLEDSRDVLLIQLNPQTRSGAPSTSTDIMHRVNEITFNASLLAELRALEFFEKRLAGQRGGNANAPAIRLHRIGLYEEVPDAEASTKASLDAAFYRGLRDHGRNAAAKWLAANRSAIGKRGTMGPFAGP